MILELMVLTAILQIDSMLCQLNCTSRDYVHCGGNDPLNCVSKEWWCDGNIDCDTGRDELNCKPTACSEKDFLCHSGTQCVPKLLQCDGVFHCIDKSDEDSCKKAVVKSCDPITQFDCNNDGENCISLAKMCDQRNDCGRNQDEEPGKSVAYCQKNDCQLTSNGGCSHFCANFFTYIKCYCPLGFQLQADNKTCVDVDECLTVPSRCSDICTNTLGGYNCSCDEGYSIDPRKPGQCIAKDGDRVILITLSGGRLLTIDLNTGLTHFNTINEPNCTWSNIDVDLNQKPKTLFWNNQMKGNVGLVNINMDYDRNTNYQLTHQNKFSTDHYKSICTGLTYNWLTGLLFWTSAAENRIYVTDTTRNVTSLLVSQDLVNPRSIVVDPHSTMLYWVSWGSPSSEAKIEIMQINMENRRVLVANALNQPMDLSIDFSTRRLYWIDIKPGSISYINLDNPTNPVNIISNKLLHPFSIAVFENKIYWSDWRQNQVISVNKNSGDEYTVVAKIHNPYAIQALHALTQPLLSESQSKYHSCLMKNKNPCSHICLPFPPNKSRQGSDTGFKCLCPNKSILTGDNISCRLVINRNTTEKYSHSYQIILGVSISLVLILCLSLSIICVYICRSWAYSKRGHNRQSFKHPIVTGDLMFIFKCNSHSSQLSELLASEGNSTITA